MYIFHWLKEGETFLFILVRMVKAGCARFAYFLMVSVKCAHIYFWLVPPFCVVFAGLSGVPPFCLFFIHLFLKRKILSISLTIFLWHKTQLISHFKSLLARKQKHVPTNNRCILLFLNFHLFFELNLLNVEGQTFSLSIL